MTNEEYARILYNTLYTMFPRRDIQITALIEALNVARVETGENTVGAAIDWMKSMRGRKRHEQQTSRNRI